eukprot:m.30290 g.30290  ORF g.30290 m.30290 type:complete len:381 (+) comp4689_c0_seq1:170-1312(+)
MPPVRRSKRGQTAPPENNANNTRPPMRAGKYRRVAPETPPRSTRSCLASRLRPPRPTAPRKKDAPPPTSAGREDNTMKGERDASVDATSLPMRAFERGLAAAGGRCIVGVDEAGRGPLAGPVVAAAVHIPLELDKDAEAVQWLERIADSKKLDEPTREKIFDWMVTIPAIKIAVGKVDAYDIDQINILQATMRAMHESVCDLPCQPDHVLVDGNRLPWGHAEGTRADGSIRPADPAPPGPFVAQAIVRGDSKVLAIAAASVVAKVTRDRIMRDLDRLYPGYGLGVHKGYPTSEHVSAIHKHGPTAIHRMTFAPLKHMPPQCQRGPRTPQKQRPASPIASTGAASKPKGRRLQFDTPRAQRARRRIVYTQPTPYLKRRGGH